MRIVTALALSLALCGPARAAEPREVVGKIADQIAARYFDQRKGEALAAELKAEAAAGRYDRLTAPLDLAQALTVRLKPQDSHFQVLWSASGPPSGAPVGPPAGAAAVAAEMERRQNYGFRGVEILPGNIALVTMTSFAGFNGPEHPAKQAADAVLALTQRADALVFDLRDNGGGSPAMVGYLVSHFVAEDANVYNTFKSRNGPDRQERAPVPPAWRRTDVPLYVLVSGRSASAAEAFSYTLQAARRAVVVGEASAGGANPGGFVPVGDGFAVFVSSGSPVNPITGKNWEGTGVIPDAPARVADAVVKAQQLALARMLEGAPSELARTEARWVLEQLSPTATVTPKALAGYAGAYGSRTVTLEGGRLLVAQDRRPKLSLKPLGEDVFAIEGTAIPMRVKFERDAAGRITGMLQTLGNGAAFRFARTS